MKLSIITINYNNLEGLRRTYDSVVAQTCRDFEWIIIDGGSTDGSKEFIEEHQERFTYWCSEPDKGVYNAMNKGIDKATGEYLQFLNSGDNLVDDNVVAEFLALGCNEDVVTGNMIIDGDENNVRKSPEEEDLDFEKFYRGTINHSPSYIRKSLFERYGLYDETLRIVSDWKFFLETLIIHNCSYRRWNRKVSCFYTDGISESQKYYELHIKERKDVLSQYERVIRTVDRQFERIQELDQPILVLFRRKVVLKIKKMIGR